MGADKYELLNRLKMRLETIQEIESVETQDLDRNMVQSPTREEAGIEALVNDFKQTGFIQPLIVVKKVRRYTIIDGHRRRAAALKLGLERLPAIVLDSDLPATFLFLILNRDSKQVSAAQMYFAWAHEQGPRGKFLELVSKQTQRNIKSMVRIFGEARAVALADGTLSPHISQFIDDARRLMTTYHLDPVEDKRVGEWIIKHKMSNAVNRLRRSTEVKSKDVQALRKAILFDRPYGRKMKLVRDRKAATA